MMNNIPDIAGQANARLLATGAIQAAEQKVVEKFVRDITDSNKWVTEAQVPDPEASVLPKPAGYRLLVRPLATADKIGNIIIAEDTKTRQDYLQTMGKVLAVGPLAWRRADYQIEGGWCKPGDIILFSRHHGSSLEVSGVKLKLIDDDAVHAIVPDPSKIKQ